MKKRKVPIEICENKGVYCLLFTKTQYISRDFLFFFN